MTNSLNDYIVLYFSYDPDKGLITRTDRKNSNGLLKKYALKYKNKSYRFYTVEEAVEFRIKNGLQIKEEKV